jgi:trans-aconitate 2-methyltransferase
MWNVGQYEKFRAERAQPFFDLLSRLHEPDFTRVVDLGCGTGELTRVLSERFPTASVLGVDDSAEMLAAARARAIAGRLAFEHGDIATFAGGPFDLVFSNAALHWVPDHAALLAWLASLISPAGVLAVQMPANFEAPSHTLTRAIALRYGAAPTASPVLPLSAYVERLWQLGFDVTAWETTYQHVLTSPNGVLEWIKGTALVPLLASLPEREHAAFLAECATELEQAYPATPHGTLFPFRRLFFVARRQGSPELRSA